MLKFDPETAPIAGVAVEAALDPLRLNLAWIRSRFADVPNWQPEQTDEHFYSLAAAQNRDASVLITLVQREHGLNVLFTRRTAHLSQHAGQISFPGGRAEGQDKDAIETALRETREEIGLGSEWVDVIGQLPPYHTITGYRVTPVVGGVTTMPLLKPDPNEVEEIFEVPLQFLMNGAAHQRRTILIAGDESREFQRNHRTFYAMPYQKYFIWGATAGMLRNLFHFLRA